MTCSLTYYVDATPRPCSNGLTYAANRRCYGHFCAANRFALGARLELTSRSGTQMIVTVVDRVGSGTDLDADAATFRHLAGRHWRIIGRLPVRVRLLSKRHGK